MLSPQRTKELEKLEKSLGVSFQNISLLNQALTHSSYAHEKRNLGKDVKDNERIEFLGDAVLKLVISEYLLNKFPQRDEGDLTKIRSGVVSDATLAKIAQRIEIGSYLLLGSNEKRTGGMRRKSNLANALEAIIAGVFLDGGVGRARDMILDLLRKEVDRFGEKGYIEDYKSALQEFVQKKGWGLPHYHVLREAGPKHRRIFWIEAKVKGKVWGRGRGRSKKEAEQMAAKFALRSLEKESPQTPVKEKRKNEKREPAFSGRLARFVRGGLRQKAKPHTDKGGAQ